MKEYGCSRTTLSRRHRGVQSSRAEQYAEQYAEQQLLAPLEEAELIKYIGSLCERGLPPTRGMVRNFASEIAGKKAGSY